MNDATVVVKLNLRQQRIKPITDDKITQYITVELQEATGNAS